MGPKIKVYRPHWGLAPAKALRLAGVAEHRTQGDVFVAAPTKAAAIEHARRYGLSTSVSEWRIATGLTLDALREAGVLASDGDVVVLARSYPLTVVGYDRVTSTWTQIGVFEHTPAQRRNATTDRRVVLFDRLPADPKAIRVVIELDADTPPAVLYALRNSRLSLSPVFGDRELAAGGFIVDGQ
jgi:hypothetical protein